jgi:hypothetical protein
VLHCSMTMQSHCTSERPPGPQTLDLRRRRFAPHTSLGLYIILKLWGLSEKVCGSCGSVRFCAVQCGSAVTRGIGNATRVAA